MCPPTHFAVSYAINPWMDPTVPTTAARALRQWRALVDVYRALGHRVELLAAQPGLPDLVFAANGATVVDGRVLIASYATEQRAPEAAVHERWHAEHGAGYRQRVLRRPVATNEAEGDIAVLGDRILAGYGFRTSPAAHAELAVLTRRPVVSLELVDPRFYHLDVALCVLDDRPGAPQPIAYFPGAFSPAARATLAELYPDAITVGEADALAFGLNAVSDGRNVVLQTGAGAFTADLTDAGYQPVLVDLSELIKGGGAVKCCTQELRRATRPARRPRTERTP